MRRDESNTAGWRNRKGPGEEHDSLDFGGTDHRDLWSLVILHHHLYFVLDLDMERSKARSRSSRVAEEEEDRNHSQTLLVEQDAAACGVIDRTLVCVYSRLNGSIRA